MPKRTYQPKIRRRLRVHGFRSRMSTSDGRKVIKRRRLKGRYRLAVKKNNHVKRTNWNGQRSQLFTGIPLKRRFRLTSNTDFERVRRFGKSYAHPFIVLVVLPNEMDQSRFGISAGRSIGNAVQRNRAKRILREAIRPLIPGIAAGWDLVILARKPMANARYDEISTALTNLLSQARLLEKTT